MNQTKEDKKKINKKWLDLKSKSSRRIIIMQMSLHFIHFVHFDYRWFRSNDEQVIFFFLFSFNTIDIKITTNYKIGLNWILKSVFVTKLKASNYMESKYKTSMQQWLYNLWKWLGDMVHEYRWLLISQCRHWQRTIQSIFFFVLSFIILLHHFLSRSGSLALLSSKW